MTLETDETEESDATGEEDDEDEQPGTASFRGRARFYRVAIRRLVILHLATLGLYSLYWFYRHWSVQKRARNLRISPFLRALFPVFFVHRLFKKIDRGARFSGLSPRWNPSSQATMYVVFAFAAGIFSRFVSDGFGFALTCFVLRAASILPLVTAQKVANRASSRTTYDELEEDHDR